MIIRDRPIREFDQLMQVTAPLFSTLPEQIMTLTVDIGHPDNVKPPRSFPYWSTSDRWDVTTHNLLMMGDHPESDTTQIMRTSI